MHVLLTKYGDEFWLRLNDFHVACVAEVEDNFRPPNTEQTSIVNPDISVLIIPDVSVYK